MKDVVVYMVNAKGEGMTLCPDTKHKLDCVSGLVFCTFPQCACPPKKRIIKEAPAYEQQVLEAEARARGKR